MLKTKKEAFGVSLKENIIDYLLSSYETRQEYYDTKYIILWRFLSTNDNVHGKIVTIFEGVENDKRGDVK